MQSYQSNNNIYQYNQNNTKYFNCNVIKKFDSEDFENYFEEINSLHNSEGDMQQQQYQQIHQYNNIEAFYMSNEPIKSKRKRVLNKIQRQEATIREKRRMLKLNNAFEELRCVLPISELSKEKLSRADTLKSAIDYIEKMVQILENY